MTHAAVVERDLSSLPFANLEVLIDEVAAIDTLQKRVHLKNGGECTYDRLCICTGAVPKSLAEHASVVTLRDSTTVEELVSRLPSVRRIVLVGNGGIALELVHALQGMQVVWVARHSHIGDAFFDRDAADYLLSELKTGWITPDIQGRSFGNAVGPRWTSALPSGPSERSITVENDCEVERLVTDRGDWPVTVKLTNGHSHGADLVVCAIGVAPNADWLPQELERSEDDGGVLVNRDMKTSVEGVWAAGDVCTVRSSELQPHWFQMRLWTQARQMGAHAAHTMAGVAEETGSGFTFELFAHVTRFVGKKVVLLGQYNGQRLEHEPESDMVSYSRITEAPESTFVRVLLLRGRLVGAVLIGETNLEEAFENLILDGLDLSTYGPALLDPDLEVDHIFD
ncbi:FAD/NAD(P)-binding domain-containing protein [Coccomyxa subellipsoidea C-169]|uniref:FAD/NAD(P)-binding domain-containing protein n=1 Tax=Coccomyxa subellipsoidea (strain C-169) TaxID=574566 RepID=I0YR60_COCSC|nr:FAD/NAD(P)-binding domain-containing protein [Coccomyxa subellipsoidea C-169]EIE20879.1 FAD/NAD(P)-binding domain-containing protein [Coccomyxa subellipsoidea C-169]|eukprot:XP_005645423.1 FAD/NAD(P)-binding domain-containing protein [Coccomyxa subellipsoidea C-169]